MPDFNSMTVSAACRLLEQHHTVATLDSQLVEWGLFDQVGSGSKPTKLSSLARIAVGNDPHVPTVFGMIPTSRAVILAVLECLAPRQRAGTDWKKMVSGLRLDGFEITGLLDEDADSEFGWSAREQTPLELRRMLPENAPELDFRDAESELEGLLRKYGFAVAQGHLAQAISNFSNGQWAASNGSIRNLYQDLLDQIAERLGCNPAHSDDAKRHYLASPTSGPFLLSDYNEWENNRQQPSFVLGLWARLHPHGGHPGLSEEDDCAFRLQTVLITARLFMRRFDRRMS